MHTFIMKQLNIIFAPIQKACKTVVGYLSNLTKAVSKLSEKLVAKIKDGLQVKPKNWEDYVSIGSFLIAKKIIIIFILALCALPIIYYTKINVIDWEMIGSNKYKKFYYNDLDLEAYTGKANILDADKNVVYVGDIANGLCTGEGKVYDKEGHLLYEGQLNENNYEGMGKSYKNNCLEYEGEFASNLYNGKGKIYNEQGQVVYEGEFKDGLYEGKGILRNYATGEWYQGEFKAGVKEGAGVLYDAENKVIFAGIYKNNLFSDAAERFWNDQQMYVGPYVNGKREGEGKEYNKQGNLIYEGQLSQGKRHGKGIEYDGVNNRKIYEGDYFQGERQGTGILYNILGKAIFEGQFFKNDVDYSLYMDTVVGETMAAFLEKPEVIKNSKLGEGYSYNQLGITLIVESPTKVQANQTSNEKENTEDKVSNQSVKVTEKIVTQEEFQQVLKEQITNNQETENQETTNQADHAVASEVANVEAASQQKEIQDKAEADNGAEGSEEVVDSRVIEQIIILHKKPYIPKEAELISDEAVKNLTEAEHFILGKFIKIMVKKPGILYKEVYSMDDLTYEVIYKDKTKKDVLFTILKKEGV